jgi:sarcosine oxidase subunit gamma
VSALCLDVADAGERIGLKGPRASDWLAAQGVAAPVQANTWKRSTGNRSPAGATPALLVARLGQSEFFLEAQDRDALASLAAGLAAEPAGVYPVLREDFGFRLAGPGVHDVLAQVCNVDFAGLDIEARPVIMTLMIGVAVLAVPDGSDAVRQYRFWCDPTFGPSLSETLGAVVVECGGIITGESG